MKNLSKEEIGDLIWERICPLLDELGLVSDMEFSEEGLTIQIEIDEE
jgi:hypothetical protein